MASHLFIWVGLVISISSSWATTFVNRPLKEVLGEANLIVRGVAGDSYASWDPSGRKAIFTYTDLSVLEVIKGELSENRILIRQPGGVKDNVEMQVPGSAKFQRGEEVVVLLGERNPDDDSYEVPGLVTGKYLVVKNAKNETVLLSSLTGGEMYDPEVPYEAYSYSSNIPLTTFKKIAQGKIESPASSSKQFNVRKKKKISRSEKISQLSSKSLNNQTSASQIHEPSHKKPASSFWSLFAFGGLALVFALLCGVLFWFLIK